MTIIEATTLDEAYSKAAEELCCSVLDVETEIVQYPRGGVFGFFKKVAIIKAKKAGDETPFSKKPKEKKEKQKQFKNDSKPKKEVQRTRDNKPQREKVDVSTLDIDSVLDTIERDVKKLFSKLCLEIEIVKVAMFDDKTVEIKFDGEDAALLIGKDGYRYKALSYVLFNWINPKYGLLLRLEVAEFLRNQEEMILNYLEPVKENIINNGRGHTRTLDGVLVQIALKELRNTFPNKYVAIKSTRDGGKFIVVNDFINKKS